MKNQTFLRRLAFALTGLRTDVAHREQLQDARRRRRGRRSARCCGSSRGRCGGRSSRLTVAFVLAAEIVNTALEGLADHLHPEQHPAIKAVKDCAAGAVLVASVAALGVAAAFVYDVVLR